MQFVDPQVKQVVKNIPLEDILNRKYNDLQLKEFIIQRSFEDDNKEIESSEKENAETNFGSLENAFNHNTFLLRRQFDPDIIREGTLADATTIDNYFGDGISGAKVAHSRMFFGPRDNNNKQEVRVQRFKGFYLKKAKDSTHAKNEFNIMKKLAKYKEKTNIAEVRDRNFNIFEVENSGRTLFQEYELAPFPNKGFLREEIKKLLKETIHITYLLTEEELLSKKEEKYFLGKGYSEKHQVDDYSYHNYYLKEALGTSDMWFDETFFPFQNAIENQAKKTAIISTDRNPKNKAEKNFDFGYITKTTLFAELARVILTIPELFSPEEQFKLVQESVEEWNSIAKKQISFDREAQLTYFGEAYYRNARLMKSTIEEAKEFKTKHKGSEYYYHYANKIFLARKYANQAVRLSKEVNNQLGIDKNTSQELALAFEGMYAHLAKFSNPKAYKTDLQVYNLLLSEKKYFILESYLWQG